MQNDLGRLIRTLKDRCSNCSHPLQLRGRQVPVLVRGEQMFEEEEYKVCSFCGEEIEIPLRDRKKRVEHFDKTKIVKEPVEEKRRYNKNASSDKRNSTSKPDAKTSRRGSRGNNKRGS